MIQLFESYMIFLIWLMLGIKRQLVESENYK